MKTKYIQILPFTFYSIMALLSSLVLYQACTTTTQSTYTENELKEQSREIVATTFATLSSKLQGAMQSGGMEKAIEYCHINAIPLTDSLSNAFNVSIKRATNKWRNPKNKASQKELEVIETFNQEIRSKQTARDTIVKMENMHMYYAPIRIQGLCLKCHGPEHSIDQYELIKAKYPDDRAINYALNDLRGIWVVSIDK